MSYLLLDDFRNPYDNEARRPMPNSSHPAPGTRVRLVHCNDPWTHLKPGTLGTVTSVDAVDTIHVAWDTGQHLGLCLDDGDAFTVVSTPRSDDVIPETGRARWFDEASS